mmetsp:Transcript_27145/g.54316  ORF Transcript_27145/g.54316 Transcript_27145/m.54316 type:complete len:100 (+) Transcript_27145:223-522(+)|eukprot:CAMPEP_0194304860 /NCGR_PEP_ID=MMETSP0171-20130528/2461_1 /TAXON_ID=218684 /ORGANISM="Corethron pennatum, Strain L29A3" /LENGTH=99 /DNA_ID=CAMNT_0039056231 /DNA_START=185 /DNA_END=484 /DNA_ORIENTATION=+
MPELKRFVKSDEGAAIYKNLDVEFVSGAKPILTIFDDGVEVEEIQLSDMKFSELHSMVLEKGFTLKPEVEEEAEEAEVEKEGKEKEEMITVQTISGAEL